MKRGVEGKGKGKQSKGGYGLGGLVGAGEGTALKDFCLLVQLGWWFCCWMGLDGGESAFCRGLRGQGEFKR